MAVDSAMRISSVHSPAAPCLGQQDTQKGMLKPGEQKYTSMSASITHIYTHTELRNQNIFPLLSKERIFWPGDNTLGSSQFTLFCLQCKGALLHSSSYLPRNPRQEMIVFIPNELLTFLGGEVRSCLSTYVGSS